jgi:CheY-like chemotaxis protein
MPALLALARAVEMKQPFKVVLIDGRLCRVTGIEIAERVAAQEWAGNPGIVVLTAGLNEDDLEGHEEVKARLYAGDPFDVAALTLELAAAAPSGDDGAAARVFRVLVVDDNSTNLFLVKDFLKRLPGFEVEAVDGGEVAVRRATNSSFDLILMDMQMPVVDGRTATRRIRQFEREHGLPEIPIIAFTAHSLEIELAEATAAGCNGHLIKPAKKQKVIDTVLTHLKIPLKESGGERGPGEAQTSSLPIRALGQEQFRDHTGDYLARLAESLTQAEAALKLHDFKTVKEISHKWIGPGVALGLPEISDEGGLLQNAAGLSNEPVVEAQLARIRDYTKRLQVVFEGETIVRKDAR